MAMTGNASGWLISAMVSPIWASATPVTLTISPEIASGMTSLVSPWLSYIFSILPFTILPFFFYLSTGIPGTALPLLTLPTAYFP